MYVPNLYRGNGSYEVSEAKHNMGALDWKGAVEDITAAALALKAESPGIRVGTIGFCMGGALSLASGCLAPGVVDAAVAFYGVPSAGLCDLSTMRTPCEGVYELAMLFPFGGG